jgi:hypothetical protein
MPHYGVGLLYDTTVQGHILGHRDGNAKHIFAASFLHPNEVIPDLESGMILGLLEDSLEQLVIDVSILDIIVQSILL